MNLVKSTYQDANGNIWEIERIALKKITKRGEYIYWEAECKSLKKSVRGNLKRDVINQINQTIKK